MKKVLLFSLLLAAGSGLAELEPYRTRMRQTPIETVQKLADQNVSEAQLELALRLYFGHQVEQDSAAAFGWMQRAAALNNPEALYLLYRMLSDGIGVQADPVKAEKVFIQALVTSPDDGRLIAQYTAYLNDKKEQPEALGSFIGRCAAAGYFPAYKAVQFPRAVQFYEKGEYRQAAELFKALVSAGDSAGSFYLARMYSLGQGGLPEDYVEAFDLYLKAAQTGHAEAQYQLALAYETGKGTGENPDEAAVWFENAAGNGHREAQFRFAELAFAAAAAWSDQAELSIIKDDERLEAKNKYRQKLSLATKWYQTAAERGHPGAQYAMGRIHASAEGAVRDYEAAAHLYMLAADQGHVEARFYLGLMFHAGLGVPQDTAQALQFYEQAADRGLHAAQFYLGNCYRFGTGVEQNAEKGENYYLKKILNNEGPARREDSSVLPKDPWVLRAAMEYGVILWRKAASEPEMDLAGSWMAWAATYRTPDARDVLKKMILGKRRREDAGDAIKERPVDPAEDAVARMRGIGLYCPYLLEDIKELYGRPGFRQIIAAVTPRSQKIRNIAGDEFWELYVRYNPPLPRELVGVNGVLLLGVEFTDVDSGDKYWVFDAVDDPEISFGQGSDVEVSMFVDVSSRRIKPRSWVVMYGHRVGNSKMVAVLDQRQSGSRMADFEQWFMNNRYASRLDSTVSFSVDIENIADSINDPENGDSIIPDLDVSL